MVGVQSNGENNIDETSQVSKVKEKCVVQENQRISTGLRHDHINPNGRIIFCLGSNGGPFDRKSDGLFDRSMPLASLPALRAGIDIAIIPAGEIEEEVAGFYRQILGLEPWQIQFAPGGFCTLETSVCGDMEEEIRHLAGEMPSILLTYNRHEAAEWLAERLQLPLYGDTWRWRKEFGKVALHRHITPGKRRGIALDEMSTFCTPRGYVADTKKELQQAVMALADVGVTKLVLKPAFSDAGEGIIYVTARDRRQIEGYEFKLGPVIVEERITLAYDSDMGGPISPSIHWAGKTTGLPTSQLVEDGEYRGTCYPAQLCNVLSQQAQGMVQAYVNLSEPQGLGGLDFIGGSDGKLYLCDVNNGRCTEAIPPLLFAAQYNSVDAPACLLARKYVPECSIWALWDKLLALGIGWQPHRRETAFGVFPIMHLDGVTGMLAAFAPNVKEAKSILAQAVSDS